MVTLILTDGIKARAELPKFEKILSAWELKIVEQVEQDDKIKIVIDAQYYSQANLVLGIARTNFDDKLIAHEVAYQPDPPTRYKFVN
jgi:hypothetical protein